MTTELREHLQARLAGAYTIERELGGGGMSRVFLAEDVRLGRRVVVKVLHPELAAGINAARFEREIRLAAGLQHPHVVPVHAAGEVDGLPYFTMPYVAGESLRARLARDGALPVREAVRLLRELADALCYAHERGVVHRDLKPENVLLSGGHLMIADFGVAKALVSATQGRSGGPEPAASVTGLGAAVGTPAYMAPEQAVGDASLDHRADLYAMGVIAYELLAGTHPFAGRPASAMVAAHLTETPAPLAGRRPDTPAALARLVERLLAKRPDERPASAHEVVGELDALGTPSGASSTVAPAARPVAHRLRHPPARWGALAAVALAVVAGAGLLVRRSLGADDAASAAAANGADAASVGIAILPFESRGPAEDDYFADGLADAVRSQLAQLPALRVIDGRSAGQYKGSTKSVQDIGRELGVPYVLEASVQWARGADGTRRVQVSPALVRVADGATVWSVPFTPGSQDVFEAQAAVASQVAQALDVRLGRRERARFERPPTTNPAAYEAYLRGLALKQRASLTTAATERHAEATQAFAQAVALDPAFGLAWAQLAFAHLGQGATAAGVDSQRIALARAALDSATRLAPELPETHLARGAWAYFVENDGRGALAAFQAAHAARPSDAESLQWLGLALVWTPGRLVEGVEYSVRAAELDPRNPALAARAASHLLMAGRHHEALRYAERAIALAPDEFWGYAAKAHALIDAGAGAPAARAVIDSAVAHLGVPMVMRSMLVATWPSMNPSGILGEPYVSRMEALALADYPVATLLDQAVFFQAKANHWRRRGNPSRAAAYCDSVRAAVAPAVAAAPREELARQNEGWLGGLVAVANACVGRRSEALEWAAVLAEFERNPTSAVGATTTALWLARTHVLLGEPDSAVAHLERALVLPRFLSPEWLRVDPFYAPLRGHPRFEALLAPRPR